MTKGELITDLEDLKRKYEQKCCEMAEILATYMTSLDEINWIMDLRHKNKDWFDSSYKYKNHFERIKRHF